MSYTTGTTHYNLPQTVGSDKRDWTDTNEAFSDVDAALWEAHQGATQAALDIASINSEIQTITGKQADDEADIATISGKVSTLETTVANHTTEIGDVRRDLQDNIESLREDTATSIHAYAIGDYFYYNDVLFKATAPIAIGATIVPNTNCTGVTVMDELKNGSAGESAASVSYDNTDSGLDATNVQAAIDEVNRNLNVTYDATSHYIKVKDPNGVWHNAVYYNYNEPVALVPTMTSNTTPSGVASATTEASGHEAYKAFDNDNSTYYEGTTTGSSDLGSLRYEFTSPVTVRSIAYMQQSSTVLTNKIQYSDDGITWTDVANSTIVGQQSTLVTKEIADNGAHKYWSLCNVSSASGNVLNASTLQFYGYM